jgi:hypothetical protein
MRRFGDPDTVTPYAFLSRTLCMEWTIRAAEAGKAVLCEKPLGTSLSEEVKLQIKACAKHGVSLMEAFGIAFIPRRAV